MSINCNVKLACLHHPLVVGTLQVCRYKWPEESSELYWTLLEGKLLCLN